MENSAAIRKLIRDRSIIRRENDRKQIKLLNEDDQFHETIRGKLDGLLESNQFYNFSRCGAEDFFRTCKECKAVEKFKYRCSLKWCPRCAWKITAHRKEILKMWCTRIDQPKHLVLTQRNFPILTSARLRQNTRSLAKMRRAKCFKTVKGGCVSVEITNEGNGWHVHSHWLIDCRWLDMPSVARNWGKLVGQNYAVCKIMDVRGKDYIREVSKYVVEGSELAKWPGPEILQFVLAIKGKRMFFPFGSLFKDQPEIRRQLNAAKPPPPVCDCGCSDFIYEDELRAVLNEIKRERRR